MGTAGESFKIKYVSYMILVESLIYSIPYIDYFKKVHDFPKSINNFMRSIQFIKIEMFENILKY